MERIYFSSFKSHFKLIKIIILKIIINKNNINFSKTSRKYKTVLIIRNIGNFTFVFANLFFKLKINS